MKINKVTLRSISWKYVMKINKRSPIDSSFTKMCGNNTNTTDSESNTDKLSLSSS